MNIDNIDFSNKISPHDISSIDTTSGKIGVMRRTICRYGRGCTHMQDTNHRDRFWHPDQPVLSDDIISSNHMCNECGAAFRSLSQLQLHLKRKTAWSNASLVGCRISCLVDYKEWHEGFVSQYHKSGKHFVEFKFVNERRWLNMKKVAFYIVERPSVGNSNEYKSDEDSIDCSGCAQNLAPIEDWVFVEDISQDYAFAQSALFKIYGGNVQETGHKTRGHVALTDSDKEKAKNGHGSLLYGELLPRGANKAFSKSRLAVEDASCLFDLGMGTGKIILQAFLQYRNLKYVYGVELSFGRYSVAEEAALHMVKLLGDDRLKVIHASEKRLIIEEIVTQSHSSKNDEFIVSSIIQGSYHPPFERSGSRILHLECGDMFNVSNMEIADVVMLETDIPSEIHPNLCKLLSRMKEGSRTLTYLDLKKIWVTSVGGIAFRQLESNRFLSDRFPTSWSVQRGHHFFLWGKVSDGSSSVSPFSSPFDASKSATQKQSLASAAFSPKSNQIYDITGNVDKISSNNVADRSAQEGASGSTARKTRGKESLASRAANCLPFSFDFLSFGLFSRFQRRKDAEREDDRSNTVIPLNPEESHDVSLPPLPGKNNAPKLNEDCVNSTHVSNDPNCQSDGRTELSLPPLRPEVGNGFGVSFTKLSFDELVDEEGNNKSFKSPTCRSQSFLPLDLESTQNVSPRDYKLSLAESGRNASPADRGMDDIVMDDPLRGCYTYVTSNRSSCIVNLAGQSDIVDQREVSTVYSNCSILGNISENDVPKGMANGDKNSDDFNDLGDSSPKATRPMKAYPGSVANTNCYDNNNDNKQSTDDKDLLFTKLNCRLS